MYARILAPVDGSETSTRGLIEAINMAKAERSHIRLLHVFGELIAEYAYNPTFILSSVIDALQERGTTILDDAAALVRQHGLDVDKVLLASMGRRAAEMIIEQARQWPAELIVMGTHGRRGIGRLALGSDAEQVLRAAEVPVLLVRGADRRRPPALRPMTTAEA